LCEHASPTIANCLIVGNRSLNSQGGTVYAEDSEAVLTNCTIADNYADWSGATLLLVDSNLTVTNCILWNEATFREVRALGTSEPTIQYCAVRGSWPDWGNIGEDPLFARPGAWVSAASPGTVLIPQNPQAIWADGDYHLLSQPGRWDPDVAQWVEDGVTSPCIDAGLEESPVRAEPAPNGGRINMGAYGGTAEASRGFPDAGGIP
jgi:hypothetical protein